MPESNASWWVSVHGLVCPHFWPRTHPERAGLCRATDVCCCGAVGQLGACNRSLRSHWLCHRDVAEGQQSTPHVVVAYEVALRVILSRISPRPVCEAGSLFRDVRDERCGKEPEQAIELVHRIAVPRRSAALQTGLNSGGC